MRVPLPILPLAIFNIIGGGDPVAVSFAVEVAKTTAQRVEDSIGCGKVPLLESMPDGACKQYWYMDGRTRGGGRRRTHEDVQLRAERAVSHFGSTGMSYSERKDRHMLEAENCWVLASAAATAKELLLKFNKVSAVGDEARFGKLSNVIAFFVNLPWSEDGDLFGFMAPTAVLSDLHVDLNFKDINCRIEEALSKAYREHLPKKRSVCQQDPLMPSYSVLSALDDAVACATGDMRLNFCYPLMRSIAVATGGRYVVCDGKLAKSEPRADGPNKITYMIRDGCEDEGQLGLVSDQASPFYTTQRHLAEDGYRSTWCPDESHQESNTGGHVEMISGMSDISNKLAEVTKLKFGAEVSEKSFFCFVKMRDAYELTRRTIVESSVVHEHDHIDRLNLAQERFDMQFPGMCEERNVDPSNPASRFIVQAHLSKLAHNLMEENCKRWFAKTDKNWNVICNKRCIRYLVDNAIVINGGTPHADPTDDNLALSELYDKHGKSRVLVAWAVLNFEHQLKIGGLWLNLMYPFRHNHGSRLKLDRLGDNAGHITMTLRAFWANGGWMQQLNDVCKPMVQASKQQLRDWGILHGKNDDIDKSLIIVEEKVCRSFCADWAKYKLLWWRAPYCYMGYLSKNASDHQALSDRLSVVVPATLAFEELLANLPEDDPEQARLIRKYDAGWFSREEQLVIELSVLLYNAGFRTTAALFKVLTKMGLEDYHEQGIENIFKAIKRCMRKGENNTISVHRLYACARVAASSAFPNVQQPLMGRDEFEKWQKVPHKEVERLLPPNMSIDKADSHLMLHESCFFTSPSTCSVPKLPPQGLRKTGPSHLHSNQFAFEECLRHAGFQRDLTTGKFTNMRAITHSWISGLVPSVHDLRSKDRSGPLTSDPIVLVNAALGAIVVVLTILAERLVVSWPLRFFRWYRTRWHSASDAILYLCIIHIYDVYIYIDLLSYNYIYSCIYVCVLRI